MQKSIMISTPAAAEMSVHYDMLGSERPSRASSKLVRRDQFDWMIYPHSSGGRSQSKRELTFVIDSEVITTREGLDS